MEFAGKIGGYFRWINPDQIIALLIMQASETAFSVSILIVKRPARLINSARYLLCG
jgi:hypothetical protein